MNSIILSRINKVKLYLLKPTFYKGYNGYVELELAIPIPSRCYIYTTQNISPCHYICSDFKYTKSRYIDIYDFFTWNLQLVPIPNFIEGDFILASEHKLTKEQIWDILSTTDNKHIIKILSYHV